MMLRGPCGIALGIFILSSCASAGDAAVPGPAEIWHDSRLVGFARMAEDGQVTVVAGIRPDGASLVAAGSPARSVTVFSLKADAPLISEARALLGSGMLVADGPERFAALPEEKQQVVLALDDPSTIAQSLPEGALLVCTLEAYAAMRGLEVTTHTVSARPAWQFTKPVPWMGRIPEGSTMPWFGGEEGAYVQRSLGKDPVLPENAVVRA
ncbi:MAG: hypothetical protein RBS80_31070, partial [Thermoguttaceae bacterium]|nr:hypothetical protein [Thermoguttaceae bacterium]